MPWSVAQDMQRVTVVGQVLSLCYVLCSFTIAVLPLCLLALSSTVEHCVTQYLSNSSSSFVRPTCKLLVIVALNLFAYVNSECLNPEVNFTNGNTYVFPNFTYFDQTDGVWCFPLYNKRSHLEEAGQWALEDLFDIVFTRQKELHLRVPSYVTA